MSAEISVLNANKEPEGQQFYVMECTLMVERTETLGNATTERRAELNGYLSKKVLESALDMLRKAGGRMSMISAQIDELRKAAEYYDGSEVASIMRKAADTIWQLRDDLQRTNAEYAKLRDEFDKMDKWHSAELIAEMDENAKLRKLAKRMYAAFQRVFPDGHRLDFEQDMRELEVEVDDA